MRVGRRGLTIPEALVCLAILALLGGMFMAIFSQARSSTDGGADRLELRATHRETQVRIAQLLRSAIAPNEVDPALVVPEVDETTPVCRFHAPENYLDPSLSFTPRTPSYPEYSMSLYPVTGQVHLQRSDGTGPSVRMGRGFSDLTFERDGRRKIVVSLTSEKTVRGISSAPKTITEGSRNAVMLPGAR